MGKVARQSIISSFSAYLGVAIGYLNIVILMPKYMSLEEIGLFRTIISISMVLVPFAFFGSGAAIIKFHPKYKNQMPRLLGLLVVCILVAFSFVLLLAFIFQDFLFSLFEEKASAINDYFDLVFVLLLLMVIYNFFQALSRSYRSIILPNFLTDFLYKSLHSGVILLLGLGLLTFHEYLQSHVVIYILLCVVLGILVVRSFQISFSFHGIFQRKFFREIFDFTSFSFLGSFGILMVFQIDQIMVSQMLGLAENGIYSTAVFMGIVIEMPKKYVNQIMGPFISEDLHNNRMDEINLGYRKTSNVLIWIGGFIFIVLTLNLGNIYEIMPNGENFSKGLWIVYIVGMTKLMMMSFSVSGEIISVSKFYRINVLLICALGLMTILTNRIFIPIYGMMGAAIASFLTLLIFNIIKFFILKVNFSLDPFSIKTLYILLYLAGTYGLITMLPTAPNPWVDIFIKCTVIFIMMIISIYTIKPSGELIGLINKIKRMIIIEKK